MKTVQEIKLAIQRLPLDERAEIAAELCHWNDDDWDQQMKAAAPAAGKISEPGSQAAFSRAGANNSSRERWS